MVAGCALKNFSKERCGIKILRRKRNSLIFTDAIRNSFQIDGEMRHEKKTTTTKRTVPTYSCSYGLNRGVYITHITSLVLFYIYIKLPQLGSISSHVGNLVVGS